MSIAPITGKVRKQLIREISTALGLGTAGAYAYWLVLFIGFPT